MNYVKIINPNLQFQKEVTKWQQCISVHVSLLRIVLKKLLWRIFKVILYI